MRYILVLLVVVYVSGHPVYESLAPVRLNKDGTVADTPEVAAAKADHLRKLAEAGGVQNTNSLIAPRWSTPQNTQLVYVKPAFGPYTYSIVPVPRLRSQVTTTSPSWSGSALSQQKIV